MASCGTCSPSRPPTLGTLLGVSVTTRNATRNLLNDGQAPRSLPPFIGILLCSLPVSPSPPLAFPGAEICLVLTGTMDETCTYARVRVYLPTCIQLVDGKGVGGGGGRRERERERERERDSLILLILHSEDDGFMPWPNLPAGPR